MPFFPSFPANADVSNIYKAHSKVYLHWIRMGDEVMTKEGPLTQGERELIATYVSALNDCSFCRASHAPSMELHGIEGSVIDALLTDIGSAPVDDKIKPILVFAKKLTLTPSAMSQADADAVYDAGWDEEALHAAIGVVCRFNFMNRLVMAHGLTPPDSSAAQARAQARKEMGYGNMHGKLDAE